MEIKPHRSFSILVLILLFALGGTVAQADPQPAIVNLGKLFQQYDGTPKSVLVVTYPAGLAVQVTYNGSTNPPTMPDYYTVVATVTDPAYVGGTTNSFDLFKILATVNFDNLFQLYDGTPKAATITTIPPNLTVAVTYNGSNSPPSAVGSYTVHARINDLIYQGDYDATLVITSTDTNTPPPPPSNTNVSLTLANLSQIYDGTPKAVSVTVNPANLAVETIYHGSLAANMIDGHFRHTATLLPNGKVLVAGGYSYATLNTAELFDPAVGTWTTTSPMLARHSYPTATLLTNGTVLVVGAGNPGAEIYDPGTKTWTPTVGPQYYSFSGHTATMLTNGTVLVAGGSLAAIYYPESGTWTNTGIMHSVRQYHTATLLPNGQVLVTGGSLNETNIQNSAEVFDPGTGSWTAINSMQVGRQYHTATLLPNGRVLVTGGLTVLNQRAANAEVYDPATGLWGSITSLTAGRALHTATLLPNGRVLLASGDQAGTMELYDPIFGTWSATLALSVGRVAHTATLLADGSVLIAGGASQAGQGLPSAEMVFASTGPTIPGSYGVRATIHDLVYQGSTNGTLVINKIAATVTLGNLSPTYNGNAQVPLVTTVPPGLATILSYNGVVPGVPTVTGPMITPSFQSTGILLNNGKVLFAGSGEIYNPAAGTWALTAVPRGGFSTTLLANGKVLIAGGTDTNFNPVANADLYDPATGTWTPTGPLNVPRARHSAILLANGKVLVMGGADNNNNSFFDAELYDPVTGTWTVTGGMIYARMLPTPALLPNGKVLVVGGGSIFGSVTSSELYDPATGTWAPTGAMNIARDQFAAVSLPDGRVLVTGGNGTNDALFSAELYDPAAGTWAMTGNMHHARYSHTATLLADGRVLVTGGRGNDLAMKSVEFFDPATATWTDGHPLNNARYSHSATLLADGRVLVAGGTGFIEQQPDLLNDLNIAEVYNLVSGPVNAGSDTVVATVDDPFYQGSTTNTLVIAPAPVTVTLDNLSQAYDGTLRTVSVTTAPPGVSVQVAYNGLVVRNGPWVPTGAMHAPRSSHTATVLANGNVLVAGGYQPPGAELYDPFAGTWTNTGTMQALRENHTATLLPNGQVLVAGGADNNGGFFGSAELFNPGTGAWTAAGGLDVPRIAHSATLLANGKVLVAGGGNGTDGVVTNALLYDPGTGAWTPTGSTLTPHAFHAATRLANGKVLVAGGVDGNFNLTSSSEIYDPATGTWAATGAMIVARQNHTFALLANGKVLAIAGDDNSGATANTELYDPASGTWAASGALHFARDSHISILLTNGQVLVAGGGRNGVVLSNSELYNPTNGTWSLAGDMTVPRYGAAAALLPDQSVLVEGGSDGTNGLASAELYAPGRIPVAPGIYTVVATVNDPNYVGSASNTMVIQSSGAAATVTLENLAQNYDGTPKSVSVTTDPPGLAVMVTYNGVSSQPTAAGSYTVFAVITDLNYQGTATGTLVITILPTASVTLSNLTQIYNGAAKPVSVTTVPPGLPVNVTYNGSANPPTNVGSYTVAATVTGPGYQGGATNTLSIIGVPTLLTQPVSQMPSFGAPAILSVTSSGGGPYSYQWQLNGTNIDGATASTYSVTQGGQYQVIVTNLAGSVTSSTATVTFLRIAMYPGLTLDGSVGSQYRIDYFEAPSPLWVTQTNITLTTSPYLYLDTTSPVRPMRVYRAVPLP